MEGINREMTEEVDSYDFVSFGALNRKFHMVAYSYSPNTYLVENIKQTWNRLDAIRPMGCSFNPIRAKASIKEHETILEMIGNQDPVESIEQFLSVTSKAPTSFSVASVFRFQ